MNRLISIFFVLGVLFNNSAHSQEFKLITSGYFQNEGVNIMAFDDIYPEGHQGGVSLIMHGNRVATNGDIRLEPTPGQWQPVPKQRDRKVDPDGNTITAFMSFPDSSRHMTGFNPMIYTDLVFDYTVTVKGVGGGVVVTVDLEKPIPQQFIGKVGFNLELFPGALFGKPWIMDSQSGIFPLQPNGPTREEPSNHPHAGDFNPEGKASADQLAGQGYSPIIADDIVSEPYATGNRFVVRPDDPLNKFTIESQSAELKLYDGRMNHNNGWFVVRSEIPAGKTSEAIKWVITPNVVNDWLYEPVVQTSQMGYHTNQKKVAVIELDNRETKRDTPALYRITEEGEQEVLNRKAEEWGQFLRYSYLEFDFSEIKDPGLYQVRYGNSVSSVFRIAEDIYDRGVWQPVLEYFLPVQMCHMRVNEKYRVWHDACHLDDARMAPVDFNHIDGYSQGVSTLTSYSSGDVVPGLNIGGWHDAGDFDLRVESQAGETYILTLAYEAFDINYDVTTVDQHSRITEIHQPDGKSDLLQQIENGTLSVVGSYKALGRLYRGIICNDLRQYVMLGDAAAMTDNEIGNEDDRWVFTEDNPRRELTTAAQLAAASRVLKNFNDTLSRQALESAEELYEVTQVNDRSKSAKIHAAVELYLTTENEKYKTYLLSETSFIKRSIGQIGWIVGRAEKKINDPESTKEIREAMVELSDQIEKQGQETPYGIPYRPHIWGAGWNIQSFGFKHYFLHTAYPDIFEPKYIYNALNFILGCHPGANTSSFASGIGARSATVGYGLNRADWSYIPGGVISGTALIRPDFPELLEFPYLWQQVEYVMGGGSSHYMFLVLAAQQLLSEE
ncbi:N-terminal ig-like domain of cellulase [Tangfeifania diversioriginum]|uniref:N-terminal ig-like domain of cellulase n=1 Tax=Tangfeifania diversioriginum TaxID=1168035 RepID=A0A1M6N3P8_9BACT|nr:glycoside hydrolase family 9 protein [Tangfeifania diversioriginum]SHJ90276.1 N-terminal ig-like domain of cellulase [Tangfeifania diversioriginum]